MVYLNEKFITDKKGHKSAVIIPFAIYKKIVDIIEEAEDYFDFKKLKREKSIPYNKYRQQRLRKSKHV